MDKTKIERPNVVADIESISDEVAIELIRNGDINAFEIIMRRHNQRLYRIARTILQDNDAAQDAVQQTYISVYYKLDSYLPTGRFRAWLSRITINEALMIKRKPDYRLAETKDSLDNDIIPDTGNNPAKHHANKELADLIETAIDDLPEEFRTVFVLRAIQQLSTRETAESLDINETTVKTRLHRARNIMQNSLNEHIEQAGMHVFEFAGQRCDRIVRTVLEKLSVESVRSKNKIYVH